MATNLRHALYVILAIAATLLTWPHAIDWMRAGGNIFNAVQFFSDAIRAGGTAAFLSIDMAIAWVVYMIWVVGDAKRIGLGAKWGWFFLALSYVGVSLSFPIYLVVGERFLQRHNNAADTLPSVI
jgi:hypothetical protein